MPSFEGETDKVLHIRLPSSIVSAHWRKEEVALGGTITYEVETHWVGQGAPIKIIIKDLENKVIDEVEGTVEGNLHRVPYTVTKPNKTGGMYFEAEMSAHKLKAKSHSVKVLPKIEISALKWLDESGKSITEITEGEVVTMTATLQNVKDETEGYIEIFCRKNEAKFISLGAFESSVENSKLTLHWVTRLPGTAAEILVQSMLDKQGGKYFQPEYFFEASCYGVTSTSKIVKLKSYIDIDFNGQKGIAILLLPDGTEEKKEVPEGGILQIEKPKVGEVQILHFLADRTQSKSNSEIA